MTSALFDVLFKAFDLLCALSMRNAEKISTDWELALTMDSTNEKNKYAYDLDANDYGGGARKTPTMVVVP